MQAAYREELCPKAATASPPHAHKLTSTAMQPISRCREQLKDQAQLDGWLRDGSAAYVESLCEYQD